MSEMNTNIVKSEIENILIKIAKKMNISSYKVKPNPNLQVGDGFIGHFYSGEIEDKESNKVISVAIKKAPETEWDLSDVFTNEIRFYTSLIPAFEALQKEKLVTEPFNNYPELFICCEEESQIQYLAMENLKASGYVMFAKTKYLDTEHLELLYKIYGKFHALSFVLQKQNPEKYKELSQKFVNIFPKIVDFIGKDVCECFDEGVKALDPKSPTYEEVKDYTKYFEKTYSNSTDYSGKFKCLTHGDCWSNNMLFKDSKTGKLEDIKLIDFQLTRESSPIHDLSYFFYCGASKTDLANLESYLKIYHDSLSNAIRQCGEDPSILFPYRNLVTEWKENALLGVFWGIHMWYMKLLPKEEFEQVLKDSDKTTSAEVQDFFRKLMRKTIASDAYKERASAILVHAYEFGVITKGKIVKENGD